MSCSNNERSEREIKETIPFTIASKRIQYLGISLPEEAKDPYSGKYIQKDTAAVYIKECSAYVFL